MKELETSTSQSSDYLPFTKREIFSQLFHLNSASQQSPVLDGPATSRPTDSPRTADFASCKESASTADVHEPDPQPQSRVNEAIPPRAQIQPCGVNWSQGSSTSLRETSCGQHQIEQIPLQALAPFRSQESWSEDRLKANMEDFSYTDSRDFKAEACTFGNREYTNPKALEGCHANDQVSSLLPADNPNSQDEPALRPRKNTACSTSLLICVLCLLFSISTYFALFGSHISFRNFYNSLDDERKHELIDELRSKDLRTNPIQSVIATALRPALRPKHRSRAFSGIVYSPVGSNEPLCGFGLEDAIRDVTLLSAVTSRLRIYGNQCNQAEYILQAIELLGVDTKVALGVWLGKNEAQNQAQVARAKSLILSSKIAHIDTIFMGNEVIGRNDLSEKQLISYITNMKYFASQNSLNISIGISETPASVSQKLIDSCDVVGLVLHPFLAGIPASRAAQWAINYFIASKNQYHNGKTTFLISEIGWPYDGGRFKLANASPSEYQTFVSSWLLGEFESGLNDWYFFEAFNEPWKARYNTKSDNWETEWGLFDNEKKLRPKDIFANIRADSSYTQAISKSRKNTQN